MKEYEAVILPDSFPLSDDTVEILENYVRNGGHLLMEKTSAEGFAPLRKLAGCLPEYEESSELSAAYLCIETEDPVIRRDLHDLCYIPLSGKVLYLRPDEHSETLFSLVPPFAPMDAVGAPPERASLAAERTKLAMALYHPFGKGFVITLAFELSRLLPAYHLEDHHLLLRNLIYYSAPGHLFELAENTAGILANIWYSGNHILIHLINGIGKRPRIGHFPVNDLSFRLFLPEGRSIKAVKSVIEETYVDWEAVRNSCFITVEKLDIWDMIDVELT